MNNTSGYSYTLEDDKLYDFQRLNYQQRLDWIMKMHDFLRKFMPKDSLKVWQRFRESGN